MGNAEDPDRNFALLLQYELDSEFARYAQQQTKKSITKPINASSDDYLNSSKGIIDPNWELVDPTPNIANLFIAFNEKYFWGKLVTVCVVWSKRMMACAGICSYEGRGGLCKIALSEPLLKLRPRKDLVETLLHEMIHAYLFVTDNNRDRDGHGPEFHKHMNRINASSGTNVSVYHSFHDEVRLYQQHWWRCDGPCQKRHPFYGMVRRSQNRAPGPNDRWFASHQQTCGGKFIKIKEPDKKPASKEKSVSKPKPNIGDIRKYLNTSDSPSQASTSSNNGANVIHGFHDMNSAGTATQPSKGVSNYNNNALKNSTSNVVSFADIKKSGFGNTGVKSNSSSTLVVTTNEKGKKIVDKTNTAINYSKRTTASTSNGNNSNINYDLVRNHWVNKFSTNSSPKRSNEDSSTQVVSKKLKIFAANNIVCPICSKQFSESDINDHIDVCLQPTQTSENCKYCGDLYSTCHLNTHFDMCPIKNNCTPVFNDCPICLETILFSDLDEHVNSCIENNSFVKSTPPLVESKQCDICMKDFLVKEYESHVKKCVVELESSFSDDFVYITCKCGKSMDSDEYKTHETLCDVAKNDLETKHCHICKTGINAAIFADHILNCIDKAMENVSSTYQNSFTKSDMVLCLVCNNSIVKSDLSQHLDNCLKDTVVDITDFDDDFNDDVNSDTSRNDTANIYYCPVCLRLMKHEEMNSHLDECLKDN